MGKGAKIAIGCVVAVVFVAGGIMVMLFGAAYWGMHKVKSVAERKIGEERKIEELQKKAAAAHPFTPPADRSIQEDRLVAFLDVRKQVFGVYERHKAELEGLSKGESQGLQGLKAVGQVAEIVNEARLIKAQALVDRQMSDDEYRYYTAMIYTTLWAAEISKQTGAKNFSEAAGTVMDSAVEAAEKSLKQAEASGQPPEVIEPLRENVRKLREQAAETRKEVETFDVPPQNIELFKKHEADIKKYAMTGLEFLGL